MISTLGYYEQDLTVFVVEDFPEFISN